MAEGWARALRADRLEAHSAGTGPHGLNPLAVRAMREVGIDISSHTSKRPEDINLPFDVVVTVCDSAHECCPVFPGTRVVHVGFDDPPRLARDAASQEEALSHYRRVRDQIRAFVETLPHALLPNGAPVVRTEKEMPMSADKSSSCCSSACCGGTKTAPATPPVATRDDARDDAVRQQVREGYSRIARSGSWSAAQTATSPATLGCGGSASTAGGGCCGPATFSTEQLAAAIGYSRGDLAATPAGANMGLSCGNPTAIASLRPGEVVLDLGAGGGFDCFVAGPKVGEGGRVIGVDMTPDMVTKARRNIAAYTAQSGLDNVEFRLGEIESLPAGDASVDVVISNCVLNLSPDKPRVWREVARVLRPGGRVAVSDMALLRPLPESVRQDVESLVGCIAGAVLVEDTRAQMAAAGLIDITLTPKPQYIEAMTNWDDPLYRKVVESLPAGTKPGDFITSLDISARKR
jgi:arsenite methyltransferase